MVSLDPFGATVADMFHRLSAMTPSPEELAFLSFAMQKVGSSQAQLLQDCWVLFELKQKRDGYFVEFGAADGVAFSNTLMLERDYGWTGALAEPCPQYAAPLVSNRSAFISHKGIAATAGRAVLTVAPEPYLSTFQDFSVEDHLTDQRQGGFSVEVETQTLADFLREAGAPRDIDYISIDTEGSEDVIIRDFDWSERNIKLVTIEHNYTDRRSIIQDIMIRNGFLQRFPRLSLWDDWYIRA